MNLDQNYNVVERTIGIKLPIEVDEYMSDFILNNIRMRCDIMNDFVNDANKYFVNNNSYVGYDPYKFKTAYFKYEMSINRYNELYCVGLSEQVSRDIDTSIKSMLKKKKKKKTSKLRTSEYDSYSGSFKVNAKPYTKTLKSGKIGHYSRIVGIVDQYNILFRVRGKVYGRTEEIINIKLKEPLYHDRYYLEGEQEIFSRFYSESEKKSHEYKFELMDIKEIGFIHEIGKYYISLTIDVSHYIDQDEIDGRLYKAGIDTGIHNPCIIYDGIEFRRIAMDDKTVQRIHHLEERAKRIQNHMNNKYFINKERVKSGEIESINTNNYEKLRKKYRKIQRKISNIKRHWHYVTCKKIVCKYKVIVVDKFRQPEVFEEDVPEKIKNTINYNNRFHAMYNFNVILEEMAKKYGCEYIKAPNDTTRTCSVCGFVNDRLKLSDRYLHCEECGSVIDRDLNAAKNCYDYI